MPSESAAPAAAFRRACLGLALSLIAAPGPMGEEDGLPAAPARAETAALVAIREGPAEDSYTIVCRGPFEHRLVQAEDLLSVMVEMSAVLNQVLPESLPVPRGLVTGISVGGGAEEPARIVLALSRPAAAVATRSADGLELRLEEQPPVRPGRPGDLAAGALERPVGSEDLLEISVFEIPELSRTARVSEKGTISLPLLGEVQVQGLTLSQVEARLRELLAGRYLRDPQVSVFVREHGSKKVSVLGAVGKPGVYEMLGPRTLLQVLAQAGGLTPDVGAQLYVIRGGGSGRDDEIAVNVDDLMVNRDPALNLPIEPGDVISVPVDRPAYIYVDGAVKTPGRIEQLASRPMTLLQAIAKAGGATERANLKAVQILRKSPDGTQTIFEVNLKQVRRGREPDPVLGDGDVVVVPETFF